MYASVVNIEEGFLLIGGTNRNKVYQIALE
jgi:hypothetical protein